MAQLSICLLLCFTNALMGLLVMYCMLCLQEAVRCDSLDQGGSADDLAEPRLPAPVASSTPPRRRSSSVHTLKYTHPQRVISCRSHSRSHSESPGQEVVPEPPETRADEPVSLQSLSGGEAAPSAAPRGSARLDDADEEVGRINNCVHMHKGRHVSHTPGEHRSRLSQSVSPVSVRNRRQGMRPPPATQLTDSSAELRRRTLSFDATSLSPNAAEGRSVDG